MLALTMDPAQASAAPCDTPDLATLYQQWFRPVYRWIRVLAGPGVDAEDLAQEVFIVVQRKLEQFDGANTAGWLYRIVQLTVRDHRQRAWYRKIFQRARDVELDEIESSAIGQDERFERKEREQRLYQIVHQLNPKWRDDFLLFEVAGLTSKEIAALQGIPDATVRTRLSRARKEFVELVGKLQAEREP
jgi:RNA polymerase sigma-70 factor (ECF subfamily)